MKTPGIRAWVACLLWAVVSAQSAAAAPPPAPAEKPAGKTFPAMPAVAFQQRWFYAQMNLQVDKTADELVALIERASKAGYNGMVLADYKLNILDRVPQHYFRNVAKVKAAAGKAGIEIIPCVFSVGYSSGILAHDPNLAEGLPVVGQPLVAKGGKLVPAGDPPQLRNGALEEHRNNKFAGFGFQDEPGSITFADTEVRHGGRASLRIQEPGGRNGRIFQAVKVRPWTCYRLSAWVKTEGLKPSGGFRLMALGRGKDARGLSFYEADLPETGDWKKITVVINSLDNAEIGLYAGIWGGRSGRLWIDDLAVEEVAFLNVLRRPGCPLRITDAEGRTTFEEGKDFAAVKDPKLGMVPYAGEYSFDHEPPAIIIPAGSRIADGTRVLADWYHPVFVHEGQVGCALTEEKVFTVMADQAKRVDELFRPKSFFMSHDEIRVAGWSADDRASGKSAGQLLAANVSRCVKILRDINPDARIHVWNDMFDPHHNARDKYYLVNGNLAGSWEGLPKDVIIVNWNGGRAAESLKFFAERGHKQVIAGYYDGGTDNFHKWVKAAAGVPGAEGFLYTTWQRKFGLLEEYGKLMSGAK